MAEAAVTNKEIDLYKAMCHRIKLKKLYDTLGVTPNKYQQEMIDDVDNNFEDYYFFTCTLGRRSGKSFSASLLVARELLVPYASVALVAPTVATTNIIWSEVLQRLKELGVKPTTINSQQHKLTLENGSKLLAGSINSPDSLLGNRFSTIVVDESAIDNNIENVLELQLMPTLTDFGLQDSGIPLGRVYMFSTPRGKTSYHYQQHLKGVSGVKGYRSYRYASDVNPIVTQAFLDKMKETIDSVVYAQEYEAQFLSITNSNIIYSFTEDKNLFDFDKIAPFISDNSTIVGIDIGFRDASAHVMVLKDRKKYYVYSGVAVNQTDTQSIVDLFRGTEESFGANIENRYCDRTAAMFANDASAIYDYSTYPSASDVRLGFALINQLFREENLYIEQGLIKLIQEIVGAEWADSKTNQVKRSNNTHQDLLMALRYAVYTDYTMSGGTEVVLI
jgi:hypothetical protein